MKISVDIDCTPEEARRFMGLPDLSGIHEIYLDKMKRSIDEGVTPESLTAMVQSWAPMGEAGLAVWRKLFEQIGGAPSK